MTIKLKIGYNLIKNTTSRFFSSRQKAEKTLANIGKYHILILAGHAVKKGEVSLIFILMYKGSCGTVDSATRYHIDDQKIESRSCLIFVK